MDKQLENDFFGSSEDSALNIDFAAIFAKLRKNWKFIGLCTLIGGVVGALIAIGIPHQYKVVTKVAPELSLRSNSLTSLASLAGVGMSNMLSGNNDALLPSVYPDIIASTPFLTDILESKINADSTLLSYMKYDMPVFWVKKVMGLPGRAVGAVKDLFEEEDTLANPDGSINCYRLTKEQAGFCKLLEKSIKTDVNKKNFLVTITVTLPDKEIAAAVSRLVLDNLKEYVTEYRIQKAVQNVDYLEGVTAEAHREYMAAQGEYAKYLDRNQGVVLKSNLVAGIDYQNNVNLQYQLYSALTSELQQARTKVSQETPVFAEILPPTVPVVSANSRKSVAILFLFLAFVCACGWVVWKE